MKPALEVARVAYATADWNHCSYAALNAPIEDCPQCSKELASLASLLEQERAEVQQEALAGALALMKRAAEALDPATEYAVSQRQGFAPLRADLAAWITSHEAPAEGRDRT